MKESLKKVVKWVYDELIITTFWTAILAIIENDEEVFFPIMAIDCANLYGALMALMMTIATTETLRIAIKNVVKFVKEIKG